jgi:hypothetical protein
MKVLKKTINFFVKENLLYTKKKLKKLIVFFKTFIFYKNNKLFRKADGIITVQMRNYLKDKKNSREK